MKRLSALLVLVLFTGCKQNPFDRTSDSSGSGGSGTFGQAPNYLIFGDELSSGGGAFLYPGAQGQSLTFNDSSNPVGHRSIRYSWTGEAAGGQIVFVGFNLMHKPTQAEYDASTTGRDLSGTTYTKAKFFARGSLASYNLVKIEVVDDGNSGTANLSCVSLSTGTMDANNNPCGRTDTLTSNWQEFTIPINPTSALSNVKDLFKATFIFNNPNPGSTAPGQGGTVYLDQIRYEP